jgi:superfamily II DNA or RNA helicase
MQSDKTIKFLDKLKESGNYNENHDYSLVDYINPKSKIKIIDEYGNIHIMIADALKSGNKLTIQSVIDKNKYYISLANKIHNYIYDYSSIEYISAVKKINIICKEHGLFIQGAGSHLNGAGCPECGKKSFRINIRNKFDIKYFTDVHGNRYDYSLVEYKKNSTPVKIICKEHGVFEQRPDKHKMGRGCPKCKGGVKQTQKDFIEKCKKIHGDRYDYSLVEYVNSSSNVKILCSEHGIFEQTPSNHTKENGTGCPKCSGNVKLTTVEFIEKSKNIYGDRYDYSKLNYINSNTKVTIICPEHGEFEQWTTHFINGVGCSSCNGYMTKKYKLNLLSELEESDLLTMSPFELSIIINQGKLPNDFKSIANTDENSEERLLSLKEIRKRFEKEIDLDDNNLVEVSPDSNINDDSSNDTTKSEEFSQIDDVDDEITNVKKTERKLPVINGLSDLHSLDKNYCASMDEEAIASLIHFKTQKTWNNILNNITTFEDIEKEEGGKYFTTIKNSFINEYQNVESYKTPVGYKGEHQPNLMQKLTVTRLLNQKYLLNLSGTGAGKTLALILASRTIDSKISIIVAINSTVEQISEEITKAFPDSVIFNDHEIGRIYDVNEHNYLVLNYEKFQQSYSEELYQDLTDNNTIHFVGIDELQNVKQRGEDESIRRGVLKRLIGRIRAKNENLYVLGMSATPVINNLTEAKSLLEIVTGQDYSDLDTTKSVTNALKFYQHFLINGIRYLPNYSGIKVNKILLEIDGSDLLDDILKLPKKDFIALEKLLLPKKLDAIKQYLKKGVCIYTYYTTGFKKEIYDYVTNLGFTCACYTGEEDDRKENLEKFKRGEIDILIGSDVIGTGVDGLQKVSDTVIEITQPWTGAAEGQLHGRFIRQGSNFDKVNIIIPQVIIYIGSDIWSWDKQRTNLIENKKNLADCAVDGKIPSRITPTKDTLFKKSIESLQLWKDRVDNGDIIEGIRRVINIDLYPELDTDSKRKRIESELSNFNQRGKRTLSSTMNKEFNSNPDSWFRYHALRRESVKDWEEIPYEYIATKIKNKNHKVVDFGCGENKFKDCIPNEVISFDHIAIDESVIACDMSDVSKHLADESVDFTIFSLALWGTNYRDYIREAYRILTWGGNIYIAEPAKKYKNEEDEQILVNLIKEFGFEIIGGVERRNKFIYIRGIK